MCGDSHEILKTMPGESVDCVVTSPPYWALRNYGVDGQIGLEETPDQWVERLCRVFDEVKRVLKSGGTCWVNLGDTYANKGVPIAASPEATGEQPGPYVPAKSLVLAPFRFAVAMIERGWILRNVVIWHKPNCVPVAPSDRLLVDFEYVFFFVKGPKYWFDADAVREPYSEPELAGALVQAKKCGYDGEGSYRDWYFERRPRKGWLKRSFGDRTFGQALRKGNRQQIPGLLHPLGRLKRTVWRITPGPFRGAHFAAYPPSLAEIPVKAGCPGRVCQRCGRPAAATRS